MKLSRNTKTFLKKVPGLKPTARFVIGKMRQRAHIRIVPPAFVYPYEDTGIDVSVVIPVYNSEAFLEQAIRSISDTTRLRYEIIAISDESPDNSLQLLHRLAEDIPQLKVYEHKNIGGSATLNRGLSSARGKYVMLLDGDDWLAPDAINILFERAEADGSEMAIGAIEKYKDGEYAENDDTTYIKCAGIIRVGDKVFSGMYRDSFYSGKLFLRSFLDHHQIRFNKKLLYADRPFLSYAMACARKVSVTPLTTAYWRKRSDENNQSITDNQADIANLADKISGFIYVTRQVAALNDKAAAEYLGAECVRRFMWNFKHMDGDVEYGAEMARIGRLIVAGIKNIRRNGRLSIKNRRILTQCTDYDPMGLCEFYEEMEATIEAHEGGRVDELRAAIEEIEYKGERDRELGLLPAKIDDRKVLFESNFGKQYGGQPRYIFEAMLKADLEFLPVWVYAAGGKPLPIPPRPDLVQVERGSAEYFMELSQAKYWVNNVRFPVNQKPEGTIYLQTWHGTPLKRLGLDIEIEEGPEIEARDDFLEHVQLWDHLLAQNAFAAKTLSRAFAYPRAPIVQGYPANDILADPARYSQIGQEVRGALGIPMDKTVVTYAPTWRDTDRKGDGWVFSNRLRMDFYRLRKRLGQNVVILLRLHHLMAKSVDITPFAGFVYDGNREQDASRILAATDILVTDYSSIFFDFACTGRPMLFYMFDKDQYQNHTRGFYFDPDQVLPGPIVGTEDELCTAIRNCARDSTVYAERYADFRNRYCGQDTGDCADRVVSEVFDTLVKARKAS